MKCPECKSENKDGSKYCKVCGNKLLIDLKSLDEREVTQISAQNTRLEVGYLLMIGGLIGYFVLFLILQFYQPSYDTTNIDEIKEALDRVRILTFLTFFCIIAFMVGSVLCIDVLKKRCVNHRHVSPLCYIG